MPLWMIALIATGVILVVAWCAYLKIKRMIRAAGNRETAWEVNRRFYGGNNQSWAYKSRPQVSVEKPWDQPDEEDDYNEYKKQRNLPKVDDKWKDLPDGVMPKLWQLPTRENQL